MKPKVKILVSILFALLLVGGVVLSNWLWQNSVVRDIQVNIRYGESVSVPRSNHKLAKDVDLAQVVDTLIVPATLCQEVLAQYPTLQSVQVKKVDLKHVAHIVGKNPYIEHAEVTVNVRGQVVINALQRTPIVHVYMPGRDFYVDRKGCLMPPSADGEASVLVGNGVLNDKIRFNDSTLINLQVLSEMKRHSKMHLVQMYQLACYLYDNPVFGKLFDQVYVAENGDLQLVPKVGDHIVIVGDAENLDEKMNDLLAFYRKGMPEVGWNTYKQISLKYKGQVICKKR